MKKFGYKELEINLIMLQGIIKMIISSFVRQIGRDAGKVATNKMFGDKHSTPYRRVNNKKSDKN